MAEFKKIDLRRHPSQERDRNSLVPQAADNQWVPMSQISSHTSLTDANWRQNLQNRSRSEIVHAFLEGETVIINRAFLFNNPAITKWYSSGSEYTDGFHELLETEALAILWVLEDSPVQFPEFTIQNIAEVKEGWRQICKKCAIPSVKLSWAEDPETARDAVIRNLAEPLPRRIASLASSNIQSLCQMLGMNKQLRYNWKGFESHLRNIRDFADEFRGKKNGNPVTREVLYQNFVCLENTKPANLQYDVSKPYFAETKALVDLIYNTNASNALRSNTSTPSDSLNRAALMELDVNNPANMQLNGEELARVIYNVVIDEVRSTIQLPYLSQICPSEIVQLRNHDTFTEYQKALWSLRQSSGDMGGGTMGTRSFTNSLIRVAGARRKLASRITEHKAGKIMAPFTNFVSLLFECAGMALEVELSFGGAKTKAKLDGKNILTRINGAVDTMTMKVVSGFLDSQDYASANEIGSFRLTDAGEQITDFIEHLRKLGVEIEEDDTAFVTESYSMKANEIYT